MMNPTNPPIVVSFGAGVQSTALAQLCLEEDPRLLAVTEGRLPDVFLFADTGDEPRALYPHLERMFRDLRGAGYRCEVVRREGPTLSEHVLERAEAGERGISMPPLFVPREKRSGRMPVRRGCTRDFKIKPLDQRCRSLFPKAKRIEKWLGISQDEVQRMKADSGRFLFRHPLVDMRWRRSDCERYLKERGLTAERSACVYCPFHSNREWLRVREDPEDWAKVVQFDRALRAAYDQHGSVAGLRGDPSLHPSGLPIEDVDFGGAQESLWQDWQVECGGVCGV